MIYTVFVNQERLVRYIFILILVSVLGLAYSLVNPAPFYALAEHLGASSIYSGRAFGFYLQPNSSALALNFFALAYLFVASSNRSLWPIAAVFAGLLMTASRAGISAFAIMMSAYFLQQSRLHKGVISKRILRLSFLAIVLAIILVAVALRLLEALVDVSGFSPADRVLAVFATLTGSSEGALFTELDARGDISRFYWGEILQSPFGHGLGAVDALVRRGAVSHSSHNQFLDIGYETGWLGLFLYILLILSISFNSKSIGGRSMALPVLALFTIQGAFIGALLSSRAVFFAVGIFIGVTIKRRLNLQVKSRS